MTQLQKYAHPTTLHQIVFNSMIDHNNTTKGKYLNYNESYDIIISNPKKLAKARAIIKENRLNQAYGKETLHYSEKPKEPIKTKYLPEKGNN